MSTFSIFGVPHTSSQSSDIPPEAPSEPEVPIILPEDIEMPKAPQNQEEIKEPVDPPSQPPISTITETEPKIPEVKQEEKEEEQSNPNEESEIKAALEEIGTFQSGGRIYDGDFLKNLVKRSVREANFLKKQGPLTWSNGKNFTSEQKKEAQNTFEKSNLVKKTEGNWKLIGYDNHQDWRYKTIRYMRDELNTPKELFWDIENEDLDIDEESGMEEFAGRLRELCYESAKDIDNQEIIDDRFTATEGLRDDMKIINLCSFLE